SGAAKGTAPAKPAGRNRKASGSSSGAGGTGAKKGGKGSAKSGNPAKRAANRKTASYTSSPGTQTIKPNGRWFVPTMVTILLLGLAWLVVFYVSSGAYPVGAWGYWNLAVGFAILGVGLVMSTRWRWSSVGEVLRQLPTAGRPSPLDPPPHPLRRARAVRALCRSRNRVLSRQLPVGRPPRGHRDPAGRTRILRVRGRHRDHRVVHHPAPVDPAQTATGARDSVERPA